MWQLCTAAHCGSTVSHCAATVLPLCRHKCATACCRRAAVYGSRCQLPVCSLQLLSTRVNRLADTKVSSCVGPNCVLRAASCVLRAQTCIFHLEMHLKCAAQRKQLAATFAVSRRDSVMYLSLGK